MGRALKELTLCQEGSKIIILLIGDDDHPMYTNPSAYLNYTSSMRKFILKKLKM